MKTEKAEKEIKELHNSGLNFDYEFDNNCVNKVNLLINKEGYSMRDIISKLKDGEKISFMINDGKTWNGKQGNECIFLYNEKYDGSIYWEHRTDGNYVRVDSSMGSLQVWSKELYEKFVTTK